MCKRLHVRDAATVHSAAYPHLAALQTLLEMDDAAAALEAAAQAVVLRPEV
jgi:hypothetical protein